MGIDANKKDKNFALPVVSSSNNTGKDLDKITLEMIGCIL